MSIIQRFSRMFKAYLNYWIGKAEDPVRMLDQMLYDMQQQLIDSKNQVAIAISDEKKIFNQYEYEKKQADSWEKKAVVAIKSNRDDLAQQAIERQAEHSKQASLLYEQLESQKKAIESLKNSLSVLSNKINDAKRNQNLLSARTQRAKAQKNISATISGLSKVNTIDTIERIEEKISQMETEAQATADMMKELEGSSLDKKIKELESYEKNDALLELKNKIKNNQINSNLELNIKDIEREIKNKN